MVKREGYPKPAESKAQETLYNHASALAEAVAAVEPAGAGVSPMEIFPEPGERRADTEFSLSREQETAFREAMAKLGIGRETNVTATEAGLRNGYIAIIEAGQAHKMIAELNVVLDDEITRPGIIIIAASDRLIPAAEKDKVGEREITARLLDIAPEEVKSEYQVAQLILSSLPGFYEDGFYKGDNISNTGGLGNIYLETLHIKKDGRHPSGHALGVKGTSEVIRHIHQTHPFRVDETDIGFVTSATYQPSREIDAVVTMLNIELAGEQRNIGILTYGTAELARVKGEYPAQPALGQLAGEAHKLAVELERLRQLLELAPER